MSHKHQQFMEIARSIAQQLSKDRKKKVGALFIDEQGGFLCAGYNGFPRGANDDLEERHVGDLKQLCTCHAELNGIFQAARKGIALEGSSVYVTELPTCIECTKGIIQAGCRAVYIESKALLSEKWTVNWELSKQLYEECGVEVFVLP